MSIGNALGFVGFGIVMWVLPVLVPGWFPHTAIDGSSERALWLEIMGVVQLGLGLWYFMRDCGIPAFRRWSSAPEPVGAVATADWLPDSVPAPVVAIDLLAGMRAPYRPGVVANAVFRRHPPQSLVDLVQRRVVDLRHLKRLPNAAHEPMLAHAEQPIGTAK